MTTSPTVYPRVIKLENPKMKELLTQMGDFIQEGREAHQDIEDFEQQLDQADKDIQEFEAKADMTPLIPERDALTAEFNSVMDRMETLKKKQFELARKSVPKEAIEKYEALKKQKEDRENYRNKMALKAQKVKDRIIPLTRKLLAPHFQDEYEDCHGIELQNGELVGTIFSHLEDFKTLHFEKMKKKYIR